MADAHQASRYERKPEKVAGEALGGFFRTFLDVPWLPPILSDALDDLTHGRPVTAAGIVQDAQRAAVRPLESLASPGIARFGERVHEQIAGEPYARETRQDLVGGAVDRIKANLPGLAETLPPRY
ncbi:MAG TPA: hypothetical protein VG370_07110, partial [Chloroflexota bacterium]|nr:hypothetical protein [Chloroflexota bacterium]